MGSLMLPLKTFCRNTHYVAPAMIDLFVSIVNSGFSIDCDTKMAVCSALVTTITC